MVRRHLLVRRARKARLIGSFRERTAIHGRLRGLAGALRQLPFPFACALLGMGADGHFASLFPDAANLECALDPDGEELCVVADTSSSPHQRISLTLGALCRSESIVLLAFGERKREMLDQAGHGAEQLPVARLLMQERAPVHVYWAP